MPIRVKTPDGGSATFPDGTDPAVISAALAKQFPKDDRSYADLLPDVGGAIGSFTAREFGPVAGAAAAAVGGAAGEGYRQLAKHATELPGAIADVTRNLVNPETRGATWGGAVEGATEGRTAALQQGGKQGAIELGGRALGWPVGKAAQALKTINLNPARIEGFVRALGLPAGASRAGDLTNILAGLSGLAGMASHGNPMQALENAALVKLLANPTTLKIGELGLEQAAKVPYSQVLRGADALDRIPDDQQ